MEELDPSPRLSGTLPPPSLSPERDALLAYFLDGWGLTERLFDTVCDDTLFRQPDPLRHPLVFYFGHPAAFTVNKLHAAGLMARVNPDFEELFAKGVDPHAATDLDAVDRWPAIEAVRSYRAAVRTRVVDLVGQVELPPVVTWDHPLWALYMAAEHDRIHFETSSVLFRQLPESLLERPQGWAYGPRTGPVADRPRVRVDGGEVTLGRPPVSDRYGWDNEYGSLPVPVEPFGIDAQLVDQAAFIEFVLAGGYRNDALWSEAGRAWRDTHGVSHPRFWVPTGEGDYAYRAMFDVIDLPLGWPVEVNAHEARAFCRWAGARLPTEAEWALLADEAPTTDDADVVDHPAYNLNLRFGSPVPVDHMPATGQGIHDVHGNVWQWLADDFEPLPGFRTHPLYTDFSEPYFDDQHAALRGGSWASTGTGASRWYRLWFRRHFTQHAGFRMVREA